MTITRSVVQVALDTSGGTSKVVNPYVNLSSISPAQRCYGGEVFIWRATSRFGGHGEQRSYTAVVNHDWFDILNSLRSIPPTFFSSSISPYESAAVSPEAVWGPIPTPYQVSNITYPPGQLGWSSSITYLGATLGGDSILIPGTAASPATAQIDDIYLTGSITGVTQYRVTVNGVNYDFAPTGGGTLATSITALVAAINGGGGAYGAVDTSGGGTHVLRITGTSTGASAGYTVTTRELGAYTVAVPDRAITLGGYGFLVHPDSGADVAARSVVVSGYAPTTTTVTPPYPVASRQVSIDSQAPTLYKPKLGQIELDYVSEATASAELIIAALAKIEAEMEFQLGFSAPVSNEIDFGLTMMDSGGPSVEMLFLSSILASVSQEFVSASDLASTTRIAAEFDANYLLLGDSTIVTRDAPVIVLA